MLRRDERRLLELGILGRVWRDALVVGGYAWLRLFGQGLSWNGARSMVARVSRLGFYFIILLFYFILYFFFILGGTDL